MAVFASCHRSGWVRLLVVILCALFIFATLAAPPAQALGVESVAVFGLASVLSAATAALGFKLSSNEQGQVALQKMVQDFKTVAWATGFVLVGSKLNGLKNGMDYIKMQVKNGKTYLDSRVFAWVQKWLAENGVYDSGDISYPDYTNGQSFTFSGLSKSEFLSFFSEKDAKNISSILNAYNINADGSLPIKVVITRSITSVKYSDYQVGYMESLSSSNGTVKTGGNVGILTNVDSVQLNGSCLTYKARYTDSSDSLSLQGLYNSYFGKTIFFLKFYSESAWDGDYTIFSNAAVYSSAENNTGLSGTDTLGKDVVDLSLDQVLQKLKEWAQDWFDAGADSATNAATGALDLPLTVSAGAATANPSIAEDGPLVWFPPFSVPIPNLRTGETDTNTVDQGKENASAAETSTGDVAENQTVIDSLVNWALNYISPDTGLFSKFPLCVPYDAYLLVTSSLGVDAVGSDSIFGASPGDLDGVVNQDIETYSDFQPIISIKHDFELDGVSYPLDVTIDLTPWQPLVTFFREGMALLLVAELIGSEFKRIRGH